MVPVTLHHWQLVTAWLVSHCSPGQFRAWQAWATPIKVDDDTIAREGDEVHIACASDQAVEWLNRNFGQLVEQAIVECTGDFHAVRFVVREPAPQESFGPPQYAPEDASARMPAAGPPASWGSSSHPGAATVAPAATAAPVYAALDQLVPADPNGNDFEHSSATTPRPSATANVSSSSSHNMPSAPAEMHWQGRSSAGAGVATPPPVQIPNGPAGQIGFTPATRAADTPPPTPPRIYTDTASLPVNPLNTFEYYIVGPSNRLPHAAALTVADHPGVAYNPLFLHGSVGLGKTHLLQAIHLRIQQRNPDARLLYISCETFVSQFIKALESRELDRFQRQFRELDCLIIDDIHFLGNKGGTQEEFFHTFNALYNAQKQIVISSDRPPSEIPQLQERLVSRFKCGLQGKIDTPVFETRVAIFRQKAQRLGFELQEDVLHFLAENFRSNVREMEGAIKRLAAEVEHSNGEAVNVERLRIWLRDLLDERQSVMKPQVTIDDIVTVVTDHYQMKVADLKSKNRQKHVVLPRQVAMFLIKKHTDRTLEEIGTFFGGRDHSTVIHSVDKIKKMGDDDRDFRSLITQLERKIVG